MDALELLRSDHRTVSGLFREFKAAPSGERRSDLARAIRDELDLHATVEEEIFYPALRQAFAAAETERLEEAYEEHRVVRELANEASSLLPEDERLPARVEVLRENVDHHVKEEEGELFAKARQVLSAERREELGRRMQERKTALRGGPTDRPGVVTSVAETVAGALAAGRDTVTRAASAVRKAVEPVLPEAVRPARPRRAGAARPKAASRKPAAPRRKRPTVGGRTAAVRTAASPKAGTRRTASRGTAGATTRAKTAGGKTARAKATRAKGARPTTGRKTAAGKRGGRRTA